MYAPRIARDPLPGRPQRAMRSQYACFFALPVALREKLLVEYLNDLYRYRSA